MCATSSTSSRSSRCSSISSVMVSSSVRNGRDCKPARGFLSHKNYVSRWRSRLQVPIHQVDLLLAAKTLSNVLRPDLADSVDGLQLTVRGGQQFLEPAELAHNPLHHQLGKAGNPPQDAEASRRGRVIEGVQLAVVAEQLRQAPEVEQILVGKSHELIERSRERLVCVLHQVVVDE